ncbi:MAG TPA: NERD domain-containing protein [Ohtaekwangia sp.]|nr:NERD domain-containing protein [Ohtaekwangia sp.]
MPIHFIDNYPRNNVEAIICKNDGTPLYGEVWLYQELQKFNEHNFLKDDIWYVKHNYNLSKHPGSARKAEGQIDFLIVNKYGILIIEVKGGGIEINENDTYYCYHKNDKTDRYESQNPFTQSRDYVHSLKRLIDSSPFIYRAVIFPHEAGFTLKGPQLEGYKHLFFSKKQLDTRDTSFGKNELLFDFLHKLPRQSRRHLLLELNPGLNGNKLDERIWNQFPILKKTEVDRLKSELFPVQSTYGFDPDRIKNEIILEENYEILNGLRKNRKVMVQGAPGTGKTVLAMKFLAENIIKQHKGVFYCANKLLRAKMEYWAYEEYRLDRNLVTFRIFHPDININNIDEDVAFIIIDEAQEFFDKGLFEVVESLDKQLASPKWLILYDPEQAIVQDFKDIDWYASFFMESSFVHYLFDTVWRCCQERDILQIAEAIKNNQYGRAKTIIKGRSLAVTNNAERLEVISKVIEDFKEKDLKTIILVESNLLQEFATLASDFFRKEIEELTEKNININSQKLRFTTPIKFRGLECDKVVLITPSIAEVTRVQNYVGVTRAMYQLQIIIWS